MNEFMKMLLSLSVSGTLLLLFILGLRRLGKNLFSRRWQYYILIAAVLRFLLPFTPDTTIVGSLFARFDAAVAVRERTAEDLGKTTATLANSEDSRDEQSNPDKTTAADSKNGRNVLRNPDRSAAENGELQSNPASNPSNLYPGLFCIWLAVTLILFARKGIAYQGFVRSIRSGNTEVSDLWFLNLLSDCRERLHIRDRVELSCNAQITSPMLIGFRHPCIVLPARKLAGKDLTYVLAHELIHYRQRDMLYKWLVQIVVCVHWFNPFVYLLEKEVNKSCELSCDETVLSVFGDGARRAYGDMLLSFVKADNSRKSVLVSITLTEGAQELKERLGAIMKYEKKSKTVHVLAAISTAAVCACFMAAGAYAASSMTADDQTFVEDVAKQCGTMKELTQTEQESILETASNINSGNNNNNYQNDNNKFTYVHRGFYSDSYIIEMGWNLTETMGRNYAGSREITLADHSEITVYFGGMPFGDAGETKAAYLDDAGAVSAIANLIDSLRDNNLPGYPAVEAPWISNVTYVGADLPALADEYLTSSDTTKFAAVFAVLDTALQKEYVQKLYDDDQIALFAAVIPYMDRDSVMYYVQKADQDRKTTFFSVLLQYMQPSDINMYAEKYYEADDAARFSSMVFFMTQSQKQEWLERAQADRKTSFVMRLSGQIGGQENIYVPFQP